MKNENRTDWTVNELAKHLRVDGSYIRKELSRGKLIGTKRANIWILSVEAVKEWMANRKPRKRSEDKKSD